jgi:uncharacterized protein (TIGR02391 family)
MIAPCMDEEIKRYAQSLYDQASSNSVNTLKEAKRQSLIANRRGANAPLGGSEIQVIMDCYVEHIDRCLDEKLLAFQSAYREAGKDPTEEDFLTILNEVQRVQEQQVISAARAVNQFVLTRGGSNPDFRESIRNSTGHGYDMVLQSWKVWKDRSTIRRPPERTLKTPSLSDGRPYQFHPAIEVVSREAYSAGQLKHAVQEAFIRVINEVKSRSAIHDKDGDPLMNHAFGIENRSPKIKFNSLTNESERDEHRGIMYLFKGIVGIRNHYAHTNSRLEDPQRAHEYLTLASLLMRLLEIARP